MRERTSVPSPAHPVTSTSLTAATLSLLHMWLALSYLSVFFPSGFVFLWDQKVWIRLNRNRGRTAITQGEQILQHPRSSRVHCQAPEEWLRAPLYPLPEVRLSPSWTWKAPWAGLPMDTCNPLYIVTHRPCLLVLVCCHCSFSTPRFEKQRLPIFLEIRAEYTVTLRIQPTSQSVN